MTTQQQARADWSLRPRGTLNAVGQGTLALAVLGTAGHDVAGLDPLWAVGGTVVGVVCTVVGGLERPPSALAYRLGCWLGAGGWLTWAWTDGPWHVDGLAALGVGALAAGMLAPIGRRVRPKPGDAGARLTERPVGELVVRRHVALAEEWAARIRRVARVRVTISDVREWPTGAGFSALLLQPPGASTTSRLTAAAVGLAEDAHLPNGCGIEFRDGPHRGSLWMDVATVNKLAEDLDHPGDYSPRSVLDGITLGQHRDGTPMHIQVRQPRTIVVGTTCSAKTGVLHTITCELSRCFDHLTWHKDLNGGGLSQPWLRPWLDGQVDRPAIDWAAPCPQEAVLMSAAQVAIAKERKTAYSRRRMDADSQLLPIGPDVPQITTVLDEGYEVLSPTIRDPLQKVIRGNIEELARIGRNEACQVLASALRSTSNTVSTDLLALFHNRAILAGGTQKEIDYLYDYAPGPKVADLSGPGSGFIKRFASHEIRAWKAHYMKPARDIRPASLAISRMRPNLDAPSVAAAGEAYATRHARMRWLFSTPQERDQLTPPEPIELPGVTDERGRPVIWDPSVTHPAASAEPRGDADGQALATAGRGVARRRAGHLTLLQPGGVTSSWGDPEQIAAQARGTRSAPVRAHPYSSGPKPRLRAEQVHSLAAPERPVPEILAEALAAFDAAGAERLHSAELAEALGMAQTELADALRPYGVAPLEQPFKRAGGRARGYAREDLAAAVQAFEGSHPGESERVTGGHGMV